VGIRAGNRNLAAQVIPRQKGTLDAGRRRPDEQKVEANTEATNWTDASTEGNRRQPDQPWDLTRGWPPEAVTGEQLNRGVQSTGEYEQTQQLDAHEGNLTENKFLK
jgi:hypothetical protein